MNKKLILVEPAPVSICVISRKCCRYVARVMKFSGWLPPEKGTKRYLYLFWSFLVFTFSTLYITIGCSLSMVINHDNMSSEEFFSVIEIAIDTAGAAAKTIIVLMFIKRYHQTNDMLDKLDEHLLNDSDKLKIHKAVARCNRIFTIYARWYMGYLFSAFVAGVVTMQPPYHMYNPFFNWHDRRVYFWIQSLLEIATMFMMTLSVLIVDTYLIIIMIIFRAHVDVLKDHIRNLRSDSLKTEAENYEELVSCVIYHKLILRCCALMRPVFTRVIFVQFLLMGVVLGFTLIYVLYFSDVVSGISSCILIIAILLETFPFCYLCDYLAEDCVDLSNTLAQSQWTDSAPKYKSILLIFMQHVQQPITFNAGGIFLISVNSNINVAKFAFSVITVVKNVLMADRLK